MPEEAQNYIGIVCEGSGTEREMGSSFDFMATGQKTPHFSIAFPNLESKYDVLLLTFLQLLLQMHLN